MKEALLYEKLENNFVRCLLCSHRCKIADKKFGFCGVRQNKAGTLYTHAYGKIIAANIDPIEKKPLYHFLPGSLSFSVATIGCNFRCGFCQNWQISQASFEGNASDMQGRETAALDIVNSALENNCKSISYTYTEPTVFFEYALDTARLAKEKGLRNNFVTNGYMTADCLKMISPYLDAANVDLKSLRDDFYRNTCSASLEPVLGSIRLMKELGIWVELTTLIIPGENDSEEELSDIAAFISGIDKDIPWHISRFHPDYKFTKYGVTPEATLARAKDIGYDCGLRYVYLGNIHGPESDTHCAQCKKLLIKREGFSVLENNIKEPICPYCRARVAGVFQF